MKQLSDMQDDEIFTSDGNFLRQLPPNEETWDPGHRGPNTENSKMMRKGSSEDTDSVSAHRTRQIKTGECQTPL